MGEEKLRVIAHELLEQLRVNVRRLATPQERQGADADPGERILRHYGYPSDLTDSAVQTVLAQAELADGILCRTVRNVEIANGAERPVAETYCLANGSTWTPQS